MNRLLKGRGKILAALFMLSGAVSLPARALGKPNSCSVDAGNPLTMMNVNINVDKEISPNTIVYTSTAHHITYLCDVVSTTQISTGFRANLKFGDDFLSLKNTMRGLGLGVNIIIKEDGAAPVTIPWTTIKYSDAGTIIPFGNYITYDQETMNKQHYVTVKKSADITLQLLVENTFKNALLILPVGSLNAMYIYTNDRGVGIAGTAVRTGVFNIRMLPNNLGRVDISPRLVQLGRFYTTNNNAKKSEPFTVTAQQSNVAGNQFTVPLRIRFEQPAGLTMTAGKQAVMLKNTGSPDNNGLQLSVEDESGVKVTFGENEKMGNINMGSNAASGQVRKTYYAVLEKAPDVQDVTTGRFEVSSTVVVTYD